MPNITTQYLAIILALSPLPTLAATADVDSLCVSHGDLAGNVMKARQSGVSIERALEIAAGAEQPFADIARKMVIKAYKHPRYATPAYMEKAISEFRNDYTVNCLISNGRSE